MQLSIVVPVYRSAECLRELARRVEEEVGRCFQTYELILVNDNSPRPELGSHRMARLRTRLHNRCEPPQKWRAG